MTMTRHDPDAPDDLDIRLREALRDDLPPHVEARLDRRLQRFLAAPETRAFPLFGRAGWPIVRRLALAPTSAFLIAAGCLLHAAGGPGVFAESLSRVNAAAALAQAIHAASSMRCAGLNDPALVSPDVLADRVYRQWVLVRSERGPDGIIVAEFDSPDERASYTLIIDGRSWRPREIRRTTAPGARLKAGLGAGAPRSDTASCSWDAPPAGVPGLSLMIGR